MRSWRRLRLALRDLFARRRFEREVSEELDAFLEMDATARERSGASAEEARRAARVHSGGIEQVKERVRDERRGAFLDVLAQDLRVAARQLRRNLGFAAVAVLPLALGIGANVAIFSVVRSVLLAPLPFAESDRLVRLSRTQKNSQGEQVLASMPSLFFHAVRERSQLVEDGTAQRFSNVTLLDESGPERVVGIGISDRWIETLGVEPVLGRGPSPEEQRAGAGSRVVLIGHSFWQSRYGGAASVLDRSLQLNGATYTVIGVMPPGFRYPYRADLWIPMTLDPNAASPSDLNVTMRLKPGVTKAQFHSELDAIASDVVRSVSGLEGVGMHARPFREEFRRDPDGSVASLLAAVGFVLLIACVSLACLLLARGVGRAPEMALRTALGASRGRQIRQLLTEGMLLSLVAGALAALLALGTSRWLVLLIPERLGEVLQDVHVDGGVLGFALLLSLVTGALFGLVPALRAARISPMHALKEGTRTGRGDRHRLLAALVVGEVTLAFVLLAGAAVMGENFRRLLGLDVGYDPERLVRIHLALPRPTYDDPARCRSLAKAVEERVREVPGVLAVGVTNLQPLPRTSENTLTYVSTGPAEDSEHPPVANMRLISPGYFEALGVRILRGRNFSEQDVETSAPVILVNESAARRYWPGEDPVGRSVKPARSADDTVAWRTVIGVVSDTAEPGTIEETFYESYVQSIHEWPTGSWITTRLTLLVRTRVEPAPVIDSVRTAVWDVDPTLPLFDIVEMREAIADTLASQRLGAVFYLAFAGYALLLASIATYGVIGFVVRQRYREFGVRLALGARPRDLSRSLLRRGLKLALCGLVLGLAGFWALSRLLQHAVSEINPRDPLMLALTAAVLVVASLVACWIPARRASRADPLVALRHE